MSRSPRTQAATARRLACSLTAELSCGLAEACTVFSRRQQSNLSTLLAGKSVALCGHLNLPVNKALESAPNPLWSLADWALDVRVPQSTCLQRKALTYRTIAEPKGMRLDTYTCSFHCLCFVTVHLHVPLHGSISPSKRPPGQLLPVELLHTASASDPFIGFEQRPESVN